MKIFPKGCINFHCGLPSYRGRHPLNWMIIDGLDYIPAAIHFMDKGIDTGDIIVQDSIKVEREDDYNSIFTKLLNAGSKLLLSSIKQIESGSVYRIKQKKDQLGYKPKRSPEDSVIDWNKSSYEQNNFIRALVDPMPNAFTYLEGKTIQIKRSFIGDKPGRVLAKTTDNSYVVSTKDSVILIKTDLPLNIGDLLSNQA